MPKKFKYEGRDLEAMSFAQKYHFWILEKFKPFLGKKVAEVGAGAGSLSKLLLGEQLEKLVAIEPDQDAFTQLQRVTASDKRVVAKNDFFSNLTNEYQGYFDSVVYINVLEHIEDDVLELSHVYKSLQPNGHVCIFVPALSWLYSEHDRSIGHFRRYHKTNLTKILRNAGFEIVKVNYFDTIGIITWLVMFKILKKKPSPGNIGFYDRLIIPICKALESVVTPPIGKNLVAVGKKVS